MARTRAAAKPETKQPEEREASQLLNEVAGLVTLGAALFALVSFVSFQPGEAGTNLGGPVGHGLSTLLMQAFGLAVFLLPFLLALLAVQLFRARLDEISAARTVASLTLLLSLAVMLGLIRQHSNVVYAGGWFGGFISTLLRDTCGTLGAAVATAVLVVLAVMFTTGSSLRTGASTVASNSRQRMEKWRARRAAQRQAADALGNRKRESVSSGSGPLIVLGEDAAIGEERRPSRKITQQMLPFAGGAGYQTPSLDLLDEPRHAVVRVDEEALRKSSEILEAKLANFGIEGKVVAVRPGPVITTFEIEPAPGVKVNRIVTLQDDLAMALRAIGVRILAPVPGKAVVGIEVANAKREQVFLREIVESEPFAEGQSTLTLALGKDSAGYPVVADLARMPHLLLAGATGTGKSVSLNAMIMSILFK